MRSQKYFVLTCPVVSYWSTFTRIHQLSTENNIKPVIGKRDKSVKAYPEPKLCFPIIRCARLYIIYLVYIYIICHSIRSGKGRKNKIKIKLNQDLWSHNLNFSTNKRSIAHPFKMHPRVITPAQIDVRSFFFIFNFFFANHLRKSKNYSRSNIDPSFANMHLVLTKTMKKLWPPIHFSRY